MTDAPAPPSLVSRRTLCRLAWVALALAFLIPAPAGSFVDDAFGISALYVVGKAIVWSETAPGAPGSLGFWPGAILTLALFSNVIYIFMPYLRRCRTVSVTWKCILLIALVTDASVAFFVPEFARLPAYWTWLLSMALLAIGKQAVSYAGWQVAIKTDSSYNKARISSIDDTLLSMILDLENMHLNSMMM